MSKIIFQKDYSDESLVDLERDIQDELENNFDLPIDEYGFREGTFTVTITWVN